MPATDRIDEGEKVRMTLETYVKVMEAKGRRPAKLTLAKKAYDAYMRANPASLGLFKGIPIEVEQ